MHVRKQRTQVPSSTSLQGHAEFDYSNHDGLYLLGEGNAEFMTHWSRSGNNSIHACSDGTNTTIANPPQGIGLADIEDACIYDFSSRVRTIRVNSFLICENHKGCFAAVKVLEADSAMHGRTDRLRIAYWTLSDGTADFSRST